MQEYEQYTKRKTLNPIFKMSFISYLRCAPNRHTHTYTHINASERLFFANAINIAIQWYLRAFKQLRSSAQELRLLSDMACGNSVIMAAIGDTETHTHIRAYKCSSRRKIATCSITTTTTSTTRAKEKTIKARSARFYE